MYKLNWQEGLKRLYYVIWAVLVLINTGIVLSEGFTSASITSWLVFAIGPAILQKGAIWIYQGLTPR